MSKTSYLILGIPALNQYAAATTDLRDTFTSEPDFTPYDRAGRARQLSKTEA